MIESNSLSQNTSISFLVRIILKKLIIIITKLKILRITLPSLYIYIYIYIVDFGESDKMIKIIRNVDKSNTYNGFSCNISFFIQGRTFLD